MTGNALLIGELKARRQSLGWSVRDVGERCAIDELFLHEWEGGSGSPRLEAVEAWAAALGVKLTVVAADSATRSGFSIDWERHRAAIDGAPVRLTPMEWKALERLAANPGEVVSHQALFRHLYGEKRPYEPRSTAIRVLITKLRRLLPIRIEAQWGRGYVVNGIAQSQPAEPGPAAAKHTPAISRPQPERATIAFPQPPHHAAAAAPAARSAGERGELEPVRRQGASAVATAGPRSEELRVIERFLAERGVTHCPDVATIAQQPLPTLEWDKVKRKWVRPSIGSSAQQAM